MAPHYASTRCIESTHLQVHAHTERLSTPSTLP